MRHLWKTWVTKRTPDANDHRHMQAAFRLARRGLGSVWPNPAVGCILVREDWGGRIVGRGWTQSGGRPHAEIEALSRAGEEARGSTAYVTLEPCIHKGETGPCAEALIGAGISRAVIALEDPDPRVSGGGIKAIHDAGVDVVSGVLADAAADLNAGFISRITSGRPIFTFKTATSLDGRIATASGHSHWITGEDARRGAHYLRASHDALFIGSGTALQDQPKLTCRLPGMDQQSPVRVVADSGLKLPINHPLVATAKAVPTWIYTVDGGDPDHRRELEAAGVLIINVDPDSQGRPDLNWVAADMASRGLTRVLVEGGAELATELLRRDLIDRICWFRAPMLIGGDGTPTVQPLGVETLDEAAAFTRTSVCVMGADTIETYERRN